MARIGHLDHVGAEAGRTPAIEGAHGRPFSAVPVALAGEAGDRDRLSSDLESVVMKKYTLRAVGTCRSIY